MCARKGMRGWRGVGPPLAAPRRSIFTHNYRARQALHADTRTLWTGWKLYPTYYNWASVHEWRWVGWREPWGGGGAVADAKPAAPGGRAGPGCQCLSPGPFLFTAAPSRLDGPMVQLLLQHGASPNALNSSGQTPVHCLLPAPFNSLVIRTSDMLSTLAPLLDCPATDLREYDGRGLAVFLGPRWPMRCGDWQVQSVGAAIQTEVCLDGPSAHLLRPGVAHGPVGSSPPFP